MRLLGMSVGTLSLIIGTIVLLSAGQVLFKFAATGLQLTKPATLLSLPLLAALVLYGFATLAWLFVLSLVPLSTAYPFYGLGFLIVPILSWLILNEPFRPSVLLGGIVIAAGIVITSLGSRA
jgi:drug/metabolite transporter (DMT)-like permease